MPRCHMRDELGLQAHVFVSGAALGIPGIGHFGHFGHFLGWPAVVIMMGVLDND